MCVKAEGRILGGRPGEPGFRPESRTGNQTTKGMRHDLPLDHSPSPDDGPSTASIHRDTGGRAYCDSCLRGRASHNDLDLHSCQGPSREYATARREQHRNLRAGWSLPIGGVLIERRADEPGRDLESWRSPGARLETFEPRARRSWWKVRARWAPGCLGSAATRRVLAAAAWYVSTGS